MSSNKSSDTASVKQQPPQPQQQQQHQSSSSSSASLAQPARPGSGSSKETLTHNVSVHNAISGNNKDDTSTISSSNHTGAGGGVGGGATATAPSSALARLNSQTNSVTNFSRTDSHVDQLIQQKLVQRNRVLSERSSSSHTNRHDDFEGKINRLYSFLLVKYHWVFLLVGIVITVIFTGVSFVKQPLPNFLDPKRGFGARGEGTLTSQLIVLKNVNAEITKAQKHILDLYARIKRENRSAFNDETGATQSNDFVPEPDGGVTEATEADGTTEEPENGETVDGTEADESPPNKVRARRQVGDSAVEEEEKDDDDFTIPGTSFKYSELLDRIVYTYQGQALSGRELIAHLPKNSTINKDPGLTNYASFDSIAHCNYSLGLSENLEFYFAASESDVSARSFAEDEAGPRGGAGANLTASEAEAESDRRRNLTDRYKYFADIDDEYNVKYDRGYSAKLSEENREEYFRDKENNLFNLRKLHSMCKWDKKIIKMLMDYSYNQKPCYFSLPFVVAVFNNKTDCMQIDANDVRNFLGIVRKCYRLQESGLLFAVAQEAQPKSEIMQLLNKNNPMSAFIRLDEVSENLCFKKNLMHIVYEYLLDKSFLSEPLVNRANSSALAGRDLFSNNAHDDNAEETEEAEFGAKSFVAKISALWVMNDDKQPGVVNNTPVSRRNHAKRIYDHTNIFPFYVEYFHDQQYDDGETQIVGINLMGIREDAAMYFLSRQMMLVGVSISMIVVVTLLYLKSFFVAMLVNVGVAMSLGVSFFAYRIVFNIDLFPFINLMAAFLLIGIACDDVYVLFDAFWAEKANVIMQDLDVLSSQHTDDLPPILVKRKFAIEEQSKRRAKAKSSAAGAAASGKEQKPANGALKSPASRSKLSSNAEEHLERESFLNDAASNAANSSTNTQSMLGNTSYDLDLLEKNNAADKIDSRDYELNPTYIRRVKLSDEQLIRVMGGTLRHAASSIFVTSFTTAAAFLTNYITKLPYVQLFGFFTGTCILVYFMMVITMVAAFAVTYDKYIQHFQCSFRPRLTTAVENWFEKLMEFSALLNHRLIERFLPKILVRFRVFWFLLFLGFGVVGLLAVFYKPQLKPPDNWRFQFFRTGNLFESFEFNIRDQYLSYINEEKRNLTNPEIFFVFGVIDKDNGRIFTPEDDGHIVYDNKFDFLAESTQSWLNEFINSTLRARSDLFLAKELITEWNNYLMQIQQICHNELGISPDEIYTGLHFPFERERLKKCREALNHFISTSDLANFENLMSTFPTRVIFINRGADDVGGVLLRVPANRTFADYDTVNDYFLELKKFHEENFLVAPDGIKSGWFASIAFALYDLQYQLITGTYSSLIASMAIALFILLLTSGNIVISIFAIITISFSIADTIAIFVFMGWNLSILESVVIIMSVGLSVDFSCHYGVAYIKCDLVECYANSSADHMSNSSSHDAVLDSSEAGGRKCKNKKKKKRTGDSNHAASANNNSKQASSSSSTTTKSQCLSSKLVAYFRKGDRERFTRINDIFERVGSAVLMAAFTTFIAGFSMSPSSLTGFAKMGQFLMLVMCTSYLFATFFFVPMCALFGPTNNFGDIRFKWCIELFCSKFCSCLFRNQALSGADSTADNKKADEPAAGAANNRRRGEGSDAKQLVPFISVDEQQEQKTPTTANRSAAAAANNDAQKIKTSNF